MLSRSAAYLLLAGAVSAQSLRVFSEFQRIDPLGHVVKADKTDRAREILSPAVARNAFASLRLAVTVPPNQPFFLFVQSNPENAFEITLYKELFRKGDDGWVPDGLQSVQVPCHGSLPDPSSPIAGQNTVTYWMDVWVPGDAPVDRVRLEALLKIGAGWVIYPMEVRVMRAVAPPLGWHDSALPPVSARADASVYGPLRSYLCNFREPGMDQPLTVRRLIRRNALQDMALARSLEAKYGRSALLAEILARAGAQDATAWCKSPGLTKGLGPEWYLRVRDLLYSKVP